jgi:tetratricopeptide (TPR) repeat protein
MADYAAAEAVFREGLKRREQFAAEDPGSAEARRNVVLSYAQLGDTLVRVGRLDDARGAFLAGLAILERLATEDPGSLQNANDTGIAFAKLADTEERARRYDAALAWSKRDQQALRRLSEAKLIPEALYQQQIAMAEAALARYEAAARGFSGHETPSLLGLRGLDQVRRGLVDQAAATADSLRKLTPQNRGARLDCARIYAQCARLTPRGPDGATARHDRFLQQALACILENVRSGPPPWGSLIDPDLDPLRELPEFGELPAAGQREGTPGHAQRGARQDTH